MQVEIPEPPEFNETVGGLHETIRPAEGATDCTRLTLPEKLPMLARLIVDEALEPDWNPRVDGLAEMV